MCGCFLNTSSNTQQQVGRTNDGLTRWSTRSYELHHKQRKISLAAVFMADAKAIRRRPLLALRQQLQINDEPAAFALGGMA